MQHEILRATFYSSESVIGLLNQNSARQSMCLHKINIVGYSMIGRQKNKILPLANF